MRELKVTAEERKMAQPQERRLPVSGEPGMLQRRKVLGLGW